MIDIAAEQINLHSPYKVEWIETNSFVFTTKYGLRYNVGFCKDQSFLEDGVYQFYIVNLDHTHFKQDELVKETIKTIIEVFFESEPVTMLYICDMSDNLQGARDRLFRSWFREYADHDQYTMVNEKLVFDDVAYYASILLRADNPRLQVIVQLFRDFVADLPEKIEQLQNQ